MNASLAILLTPVGVGAIAVVRLVGPRTGDFLARFFSRPVKLGRCVHGDLSDGSRVIDDAVVVLAGEDRADVNLHGGTWIVRRVLELARREGFELLDGPTFPSSPEALDGGTAVAREVRAWLPLARTELAVRALLAQENAWESAEARWAGDPESARGEIRAVLDDRALDHLLDPPTVAIVGAPNVGKSTLANQLFAQERSITADLPGTTRDWVGEIANVDGLPVMLLDTPGLRQTPDAIERAAIDRSRPRIEAAQRIVLVLDATRPLEPEQAPLRREYPTALLVINKCDRPPVWDIDALSPTTCTADGPTAPALRTVATRGIGIDDLRQALFRSFCGPAPLPLDRPRAWTPRQRALLALAASGPDSSATRSRL